MKLSRLLAVALVVLVALIAAFLWRSHKPSGPGELAAVATSQSPARTPQQEPTRGLEEPRESQPATDAREGAAVDEPPRHIVLAGIVLDYPSEKSGEGTPAAGVTVRGRQGFFGDVELTPVVTDDRGRFRIEFADPGKRPLSYGLSCDGRDALRAAFSDVTLQAGQQESLGIELRRYPKGELVGVTVDPEDAPVADVKLAFRTETATRETSSDGDGHFRLGDVGSFDKLDADRNGYTLLEAKKPKKIPSGGWEPMRVVLAPVGRLRVTVTDERGEALAGFTVSARVSQLERFGPKRFDHIDHLRPTIEADTDSSGTAMLAGVWAQCRLMVEVSRRSNEGSTIALEGERTREGKLFFGDAPEGLPIVVSPAGERELRAVVPARLRLSGRVEDEAGAPVPEAYVLVSSTEVSAAGTAIEAQSRTAADGRFVIEIAPGGPLHSVHVGASDEFPRALTRDAVKVASTDLDLGSGPPGEIVLVLRPGLSIRGRMIDGNGQAVRGQVRAYLPGEGPDTPNVRPQIALVDKDASFSVNGLVPGTYDLLAEPDKRLAEIWLRGIDAGRDGIEIVVEHERPAQVEVEMHLREGEADQLIVFQGRVQSRNTSVDVPLLDATTECAEPRGWPESVVVGWYGSGGTHDERGRITYSSWPLRENPTTLLLDEGMYWIGAKGKDKEGHLLFPIGTGMVRVEAGAHHLRFELIAAVPVEGHVRAGDVLGLAIGIARGGIELLKLDVGGERLQHYRELGADGFFSFAAVPVGEHELWIGTPSDLAAGRPSHRRPLSVDRNGVASLVVQVPR